MVRGQIAYKSHPRGSVQTPLPFPIRKPAEGETLPSFSKWPASVWPLYRQLLLRQNPSYLFNQSNFFVARLCGGKGRYSIQGNTLIMSHKLAPLGRTHIRQGSSTSETTSKSSSPLKEWIHTQNWGDSPSVFPEPKQLSGKNTVTREAVHVAEAARLDSTSSSSDGLVTKMHVARASVASTSSVSSKHIIAPKVASKHVVSKEPVNKSVNQSMEKVLAERQKVYEEAKAKKIAEAAAAKAKAVERAKEAHKAAVEKAVAERKAKLEAARKEKEAEDRIAEEKETVEIVHKKNLKDSDGHDKIAGVSSGKKAINSHDGHLSSGKANKIDDHAEGRIGLSGKYRVYESKEYGNYVRVNDFGADAQGKKDSLQAFKAALEAAHKEKAMVFLDGTYYISNQIVMDKTVSGARGLFGSGMGKTKVTFDKAQTGVFNPDTNHDDIREFAGILVDGQNNKTIADLSVQYTNPDFYRKGLSYFGKVNGILVNDADNTLISKVEVSGANRAGVMFTSTTSLETEKGQKLTFKARVQSGEIDEKYEALPLGENNRIVDSYLHHNRVAGALIGFQQNFIGEGNRLDWNGHEADGGTGYGMAVAAGSYNYGITYRKNTTDHNYRKGLDVHDGTGIVIEDNVLTGDRLYGIVAYNRQFSMDKVKITGNTIIQDPSFRLNVDDDLGKYYHMYSGIQVQTNTQYKDLHSADKGYFDISNNVIKNLTVYQNNIQTYAIEFRNHESKMDYTLNMANNKISGESTKYLIAVINDTYDRVLSKNGMGSGTITISGNDADIGKIMKGAVPVYVEEHHGNVAMHGAVTIHNNKISVREESAGYVEFAYLKSNAKEYNITNNTLKLGGDLNDALIDVHSTNPKGKASLNVANNKILTDIKGKLYDSWLRFENDINTYSEGNSHNGAALKKVNTTGSKVALSDILSEANHIVETSKETVYHHTQNMYTSGVEEHHTTTGIL